MQNLRGTASGPAWSRRIDCDLVLVTLSCRIGSAGSVCFPGGEAIGVVDCFPLHGRAVADITLRETGNTPTLILHHMGQLMRPQLEVALCHALGLEQHDL